jgi:hypothetical protein
MKKTMNLIITFRRFLLGQDYSISTQTLYIDLEFCILLGLGFTVIVICLL